MHNSKIIFESVRGLEAVPIDDVFLRDRKVFLVGEVNDESCNGLIKQLVYMESEDNTKPIILFIDSPGGSVSDGLAVYDVIRLMKSPVTCVVTGIAASMGSIILLACDKDKRFMLPSSRIMIHDCSFGNRQIGGLKPFEIEEELNQLKHTNERLVSIIAERTGKTVEEVSEVTKYDSYFSAEEAIKFGLASAVIDTSNFGTIVGGKN
ncbi:ClpP family protease [Butyrivibrio sp. NC2002]|jgi:ATP-dependent Clp protease protease subunit|uniref:ClpP family protease n=1 Tax=Butyrivibrio sp. NC2002 TaxID=1410610 RepID=UPI000691FDE2|nr:ATP-dependent Clp protease proteolytic subunit [Butyrivibrio sp. NC2002]